MMSLVIAVPNFDLRIYSPLKEANIVNYQKEILGGLSINIKLPLWITHYIKMMTIFTALLPLSIVHSKRNDVINFFTI